MTMKPRPEVIQSLLNFSFNFFLIYTNNVPLDRIGNKTGNPVHNSMTLDIDINSSNGDFKVGQDHRTTVTSFNFILHTNLVNGGHYIQRYQ